MMVDDEVAMWRKSRESRMVDMVDDEVAPARPLAQEAALWALVVLVCAALGFGVWNVLVSYGVRPVAAAVFAVFVVALGIM